MSSNSAETVKVAIRCRPLNSKEKSDGRDTIVDMDMKIGQVILKNPKGDPGEPPKTFTFDSVFDPTIPQREVYDSIARPIVNSVMDGYNGTIFAYGQTGTGKTHTMEGAPTPDLQGIIPSSFDHVFETVNSSVDKQWMVRASYIEIYNEEVRDLLSKDPKNKLELKEHKDSGVYVKGLNIFVVKSVPELKNVLEVGKKNRSVGATQMNQDSSRSHSIFSITIETIESGASSQGHIRMGKLNLVDLAGSERQSKTGATGDRLKEGIKINLSLTALGNVISALVDSKTGHVPYRDSKLTRLLQDSLGGNTKTVMVANLGPADWNYDETLSTLRYANRAKNIKNKPRINEDPKDAMLREFQEEIANLKAQLAKSDSSQDSSRPTSGVKEEVVERIVTVPKALDHAFLEQMRQELEAQMRLELSAKSENAKLTEAEIEQVKREAAERAKQEAARLESERLRMEEEAAKIQRKQKKIQDEMAKRAQDAEQIRAEKEALAKRLKAMESKILKGDERGGLAEVTKKKEAELKRREEELERRRAMEAKKANEIAALEEAQLAAEEKYSSKHEEADQKTKKLKKLWKKFQEVNVEVEDMYKEFQREKEDLLESVRMLQDQMQLKDMVIEAFIPPEEVQKVMKRAHWDEDREVWVLERLSDVGRRDVAVPGSSRRPVSASGQRRPTSDFAKMASAMGDMNPRFKSENILNLELDLPERTTYDYEGPGVDPRVQAAINAAFAD
eukprot:CAMPEP_0175058252 /NCGR_PEP_ID=MMETSP0052_2-20121109/11744_1 /TAXON_ID=51329 ORGANISM="Polytomella parva, Strain SAG 63-3" /NCGR_SAMPLE_ID=MMETSP0052_2 /ASSEMBLY_ACC=CAM_ASM_000194 /LENGTH=731 /DNA_ID=CAMNT_0016323611 /DNA_START=71 /DNA_END=2263 /DNA_ORIENTATION=+